MWPRTSPLWCSLVLLSILLFRPRPAHAASPLRWMGSPSLKRAAAQNHTSLSSSQGVNTLDTNKYYHFVTRPDLQAPKWNVTLIHDDALADGCWFVAPYAKLKQTDFTPWNGPHIYRADGELVWSGVSLFKHFNTFDFRTATVNDETKLSLLSTEGDRRAGVILSQDYEIERIVEDLGDGEDMDMHDFLVIDNGQRALILTSLEGNSTIQESLAVGYNGHCCAEWKGLKEVDVQTSETVFQWSAHGHIGLNESTRISGSYEEMCTECWDILHLNSIDKFPDGDYLVSSRHTDTIYKISHRDKSIVWRLGGIKSDFKIAEDAKFTRQHHARVQLQNVTHTLITLFDNAKGNGPGEHKSNDMSRGLYLSLRTDVEPKTAELLHHYDHPEGRITNSRGSVELLPNGNAFVSWTYGSLLSEHSADGTLLMKARFVDGTVHNYRAFKLPWVGLPANPPDVHSAVENREGQVRTVVHVSWNGATEVATWKVYDTDAYGRRRDLIASVQHRSFESVLRHDRFSAYVLVEGYDANGELLGASAVTKTVAEDGTEIDSTTTTPAVAIFLGSALLVISGFVVRVVWKARAKRRLGRKSGEAEYTQLFAFDDEEESLEVQSLDELPHKTDDLKTVLSDQGENAAG